MLSTILVILLILLLIGAMPSWGWSATWGGGPALPGALGVILVIVIILVLLGRI